MHVKCQTITDLESYHCCF